MKASCRSGWCGKAIPASGAARGQTGTEDKTGEAVEAEDEVEHRVKDSVDEVEVARGEEMEKRVRGSVVEANGEEVETGKEDEVEDRKGEEEYGVQEDEATRVGEEEEGAEAECLSEASTSRS